MLVQDGRIHPARIEELVAQTRDFDRENPGSTLLDFLTQVSLVAAGALSAPLVIGEGDGALVVPCIPEESHEEQLTRPDVTASVHYIRFELSPV